MPAAALNVTVHFQASTRRVRDVDFHPTEPLLAIALYTGQAGLWNYETGKLISMVTIGGGKQPVRCVRFIPQVASFVCACDDGWLYVHNVSDAKRTDKILSLHFDYVRGVAVHATLPFVLTCADDRAIRCFDYSAGWSCVSTYTEHTHFVMDVAFNPFDDDDGDGSSSKVFASASMDCTVRVWRLGSPGGRCEATLKGHSAGANCVAFHRRRGASSSSSSAAEVLDHCIVSGDDNGEFRVWDYRHTQAAIVVVPSLHAHSISCAALHPTMPVLLTGSEDETVQFLSTSAWRTVCGRQHKGMGRVWCLGAERGGSKNKMAVGCDNGFVVLSVGTEGPVAAMWVPGTGMAASALFADPGEDTVSLLRLDSTRAVAPSADDNGGDAPKPFPATDHQPSRRLESPPRALSLSGRGDAVALVSFDDELQVRTVDSWGLMLAVGGVVDFAWRPDVPGSFALLRGTGTIATYTDNAPQIARELRSTPVDALFGGPVFLAARSAATGDCFLYEWVSMRHVETVRLSEEGTTLRQAAWTSDGAHLALVTNPAGISVFRTTISPAVVGGCAAAAEPPLRLQPCGIVPANCRGRVLAVGNGFVFIDDEADGRVCYWDARTGRNRAVGVAPRGFFLLGHNAAANTLLLISSGRMVLALHLPCVVEQREPAAMFTAITQPPSTSSTAASSTTTINSVGVAAKAVAWLRREEPDIARAMDGARCYASFAAVVEAVLGVLIEALAPSHRSDAVSVTATAKNTYRRRLIEVSGVGVVDADAEEGLFVCLAQACRVVHAESGNDVVGGEHGGMGAVVHQGMERFRELVMSSSVAHGLEALDDAISRAYPCAPISCLGV